MVSKLPFVLKFSVDLSQLAHFLEIYPIFQTKMLHTYRMNVTGVLQRVGQIGGQAQATLKCFTKITQKWMILYGKSVHEILMQLKERTETLKIVHQIHSEVR